jgi:hypothetical protein
MVTYPILGKVIARALELTDRLLSEWVGLAAVGTWDTNPYTDNCAGDATFLATMTPCGELFVERLEDLIHGGIAFILQILPGLGAQQLGM